MTDEEFLQIFTYSLPRHMTKQILIHRPRTPQEALEIARILEQLPLLDDNNEHLPELVPIKRGFNRNARDNEEIMYNAKINESSNETQSNYNHSRQRLLRNRSQHRDNNGRQQRTPFINKNNRQSHTFVPYHQHRNTTLKWRQYNGNQHNNDQKTQIPDFPSRGRIAN